MDESTVLKDYITPYFELDTSKEIKVYTYNHTGKDASDNALFASEGAEYTKAQIEVKGNVVSVRNLDYEEGIVADITDVGGNVTYRGYKYSVQIPIKVKKGFLGGNNVPTNETLSGVYSDENTIGPNEKVVRWCEFPVPTVNVPVKEFTFELADKNIYANTLYKENTLITDYPICKFDGGVIDFSKGNYGLEDWQNKFVEISKVKSIPIYDYFHGDGYDKTNSNGTDKVNGNEFETICLVGQVLGKVLICYLEKLYPDKKFVVFVTVTVNDSFIIRFHQKWANEPYYYDTSYDYGNDTKVLMFES